MPGRAQAEKLLMAIVDSGSDGTLIPINVLEEVGARCVRVGQIRGFLGGGHLVDIYLVNLCIGPHTVHAVRVVASPEDAEVILGRNALNHLVITLNGLASVTEISA